jgi:hypothetical protein
MPYHALARFMYICVLNFSSAMACVYNNKIYNQGDSWTDGCKYNCTCTDARNGNYQCVEL